MTPVKAGMRIACVGLALCVPLVCAGQALAATPPTPSQQPPKPLPEVSPDAAKRLEGRLFFSAEQRQRMDNARKRGLVSSDDGQVVETPPSVLNGFVKRSDGNTAVWVDGVQRWNAASGTADSLSPSDVGGPATYLKLTSGETVAAVPKHTARAKKAVKPRVKKNTAHRPLR